MRAVPEVPRILSGVHAQKAASERAFQCSFYVGLEPAAGAPLIAENPRIPGRMAKPRVPNLEGSNRLSQLLASCTCTPRKPTLACR